LLIENGKKLTYHLKDVKVKQGGARVNLLGWRIGRGPTGQSARIG